LSSHVLDSEYVAIFRWNMSCISPLGLPYALSTSDPLSYISVERLSMHSDSTFTRSEQRGNADVEV